MTYNNGSIELESLVGEVLTHIDTNPDNDEIMLTTASGRIIKIFHSQDCCEEVKIEDTEGNWHDLIGKVLIEASQKVEVQDDPEDLVSSTRTELKFRVTDATVISKWIGESNGYYSEEVDIEDLTKRSV